MKKHYFLYRHIRLDKNEVFYIGIWTKRSPDRIYWFRTEYARAFAKKKRNNYWNNIVNKSEYRVEILYETTSQKEIIRKEKKFIKIYKPTLCNLTDWWFWIQSFKHTDEAKEKIGFSSRTRIRKKWYKLNISEEGKKRRLKDLTNRIVSDETRKKLSNNLMGNKRWIWHKVSEEHKEILRKINQKPVLQFDLDNNFIKSFDSWVLAEIETGYKSRGINKCTKWHTKKYKNFIWKYA